MDGELEALLRCYYSDLKTSVKNMVIAIGIATAVTLLAIPLLDEERESDERTGNMSERV
jgi:hypothetical protein